MTAKVKDTSGDNDATREMDPKDRLYFHHALWPFIYFTHFPPPKKIFIYQIRHLSPSSILMVTSFWAKPHHFFRSKEDKINSKYREGGTFSISYFLG